MILKLLPLTHNTIIFYAANSNEIWATMLNHKLFRGSNYGEESGPVWNCDANCKANQKLNTEALLSGGLCSMPVGFSKTSSIKQEAMWYLGNKEMSYRHLLPDNIKDQSHLPCTSVTTFLYTASLLPPTSYLLSSYPSPTPFSLPINSCVLLRHTFGIHVKLITALAVAMPCRGG